MKRLLLVGFAVVSLLPGIVSAQGPDAVPCDVADLTSEFSQRLQAASTLDEVKQIQSDLEIAIADCQAASEPSATAEADAEFQYEGTGDQTVGPVTLEPGIYVVDYRGTTISNLGRLEFDFEPGGWGFDITHYKSAGDLAGRELREFDEGTYFVNVVSEGDWAFSITPFDTSSRTTTTTLSSTNAADFVGPFDLEQGFYTVEYSAVDNPNDNTGLDRLYGTIVRADVLVAIEGEDLAAKDQTMQKTYNLDAGTYFLAGTASGISEWTIKLTPAN